MRNNKFLKIEKDKFIERRMDWIFGTFILLIIMIFGLTVNAIQVNNELSQLPHKYCHNETMNESQPILKEVRCSCCPENDYCCAMYCSEIIGYKNVTKVKEVCEIK